MTRKLVLDFKDYHSCTECVVQAAYAALEAEFGPCTLEIINVVARNLPYVENALKQFGFATTAFKNESRITATCFGK